MGNKLGGQAKQKELKSKEDKKRDKDEKKDQDKQKRKDKKGKDKKKKKLRHHVSELDSDVEESSHVTGGDSESCVFHSAENVSVSPYLDSCTRSELEQGATWSGMFENHPSSQHPQVLTSKDFRDGFSLEACIPQDIARPEIFDEMSTSATSRLEGRSSSSVKSRRSNNSVKSTSASRSRHATPTSLRSQHGDDASTASQTSGGGGGGYSTPLLSTPVFGRTDRCHSPTSPTSTLTRVQENDPDEVTDTTPSQSTNDIHHPHFYNHRHLQNQRQAGQIDFRNLPKPTSPHPQRRALSPKMTSSPFKMISSDDSSSSPSTPVPQRRAANLLDLFRSGSKGEKSKKNKSAAKQTATGTEQTSGKSDSSPTENEARVKSKPLWKTWERSSHKKSEKANKTASIFGTIRKTDGKSGKVSLSPDGKGEEKKEKSAFEKMSGKINDALAKLDGDSKTNRSKLSQSSSTSVSSQLTAAARDKKSSRTSSRSSDSNLECSSRAFSTDENKRNSSPPVAKSAAFCIMKLEELERSIEKTIREKFPDAEPFLLKKRSREELRGSRSLPTTPSLKKKLYIARDADDAKRRSPTDITHVNQNGANARLSDSKGTAQYYDATYESLPRPAMSPVVLRRFGARTRHASISPKIQRAKTAALYNSPSEMSRVEESLAKKTVTQVPSYHAVSTKQSLSPIMSSKFMKPLTQAQKSESKYDNVSDDTDQLLQPHVSSSASHGAQLVRQECVDEDDSDEVSESMNYPANRPDSDQRPVIVPTFSAVFGSVSPKLKRHLQSKFQDSEKTDGRQGSLQGLEKQEAKMGNEGVKTDGNLTKTAGTTKIKHAEEKITTVTSLTASPVDIALVSTERARNRSHVLPDDRKTGVQDNQMTKGQTGSKTDEAITRTPGSPNQVSVKERVTTFNKSVSEGWASATAGPGVHSGDVALKTGNAHPPSTDLPHNGTAGTGTGAGVGGSRDQGKIVAPSTASHLSRQHVEFGSKSGVTERVSSVTSPASTRKHSTDHVVFGTAVALPCRLYACSTVSPTSPGPEVINTVSNSHTAHAPGALAGLSQNARYVKKEKLPGSEGDKKELSTIVSTTTDSTIPAPASLIPVTVINCSASLSGAADVKVGNDQFKQSGVVVSDLETFPSDTSGDREQSIGVVKPTFFSEGDQSTDRNVKVSEGKRSDSLPSTVDEIDSVQQPQRHQHQVERQEEWDQQKPHLSLEDPVIHRQPLSLVISRLISEDKLEEEEEKQQQQQQQQQQQAKQLQQEKEKELHQSSPVSPDHGYKLVKPAIAMVTSFTYEQPCLILEEKTVHSEASVSLPSSPINNTRVERDFGSGGEEKDKYKSAHESRNQEIQTDSVTKADKSVDSNGLIESIRASEYPTTSRQALPARAGDDLKRMEGKQDVHLESSEFVERNDPDESDFLRMVLACKRTSGHKGNIVEGLNDGATTEHVPPPSPTAFEQLIEEFNEEEAEEDSDVNERKEIELAMRREMEMKDFTEKIYKRLSDLLGSQSGDENDLVDDVFEEERVPLGQNKKVSELLSRLDRDQDSFSSDNEDMDRNFVPSASAMPSHAPLIQTQSKVLTIETSSSLTTTTSSDSDLDEASMGVDGKRKPDHKRFVFPDFLDERALQSDEARARRSSREYHSDDDVVAGRGIPDYYDDRPLWSRRQKPPGQLSAAMMAIRRRERRERWLKKRRRNKTDLLSTGSSDNGSEVYPRYGPRGLREDSNSFDCEEDEEGNLFDKGTGKNEMGSGILVSPKYSKPILPFLTRERERSPESVEKERMEMRIACERLQSLAYRDHGSGSHSDDGGVRHRKHSKEKRKKNRYDNDGDDIDDEEEDECGDEEERDQNENRGRPERFSSDSNLVIPGIEETFNELMSVQNILEGMQDKTPTNERIEVTKCMPLTTENVRSVHEYYKDSSYAFGNGRRSRMSATDRTESDLDLYSETRDDNSSDSNMYADDEEDDEGNEPYTTADDDLGATGGSSSAADGSVRHSGARSRVHEDGDDSDENFVVSCTFYNSNALQQSSADNNANVSTSLTTPQGKTTPKSTSNPRTPVSHTVVNSDEEFWTGSAAIEESYRQLETAADAVSSTFQNAREQMHDIQHHLQALRRQMEDLQDDLTTTSVALTPDMSLESPGKG